MVTEYYENLAKEAMYNAVVAGIVENTIYFLKATAEFKNTLPQRIEENISQIYSIDNLISACPTASENSLYEFIGNIFAQMESSETEVREFKEYFERNGPSFIDLAEKWSSTVIAIELGLVALIVDKYVQEGVLQYSPNISNSGSWSDIGLVQ